VDGPRRGEDSPQQGGGASRSLPIDRDPNRLQTRWPEREKSEFPPLSPFLVFLSSLGRLAKTSPAVVFNVLQQLEAFGLNVPSLLQQLGVNPAALESKQPPPPPSTPPPGPASTHRQT
jgi:hypothetical protein